MYIVYNKETLQEVQAFDFFGRELMNCLKSNDKYNWVNTTHPKHKEIVKTLTQH